MSALNELSNYIAHHLWAVSWQVTILVGIIWIVDRFSRKASSEFRYVLWCIILIRLCLPFGLTLPVGIELNLNRFFETNEQVIIKERIVSEISSPILSEETFLAHTNNHDKDTLIPSKAFTSCFRSFTACRA